MTDWVPRVPLTAYEQHVDFPAHNSHIVERRAQVERVAKPALRRLVFTVTEYGFSTKAQEQQLAELLTGALETTVRFGYREARREINTARTGKTLQARYYVPDAGAYGRIATGGLDAIKDLIGHRASRVATAVAGEAFAESHRQATNPNRVEANASVLLAATKSLHNNVLELVGEALNLGRTAGAYSFQRPPEFALRSEQLDKATCDACSEEHGEIYQVGTDEFYVHMPPAECYGGGRCRGIYVFGD